MNSKKLVIITGGSRGIGKAIAKTLLSAGYHAHICARSESELRSTVEELSSLGAVDYSVLNISDKKAVQKFTAGWNKDIYGLVNNAGICKTEKISEDFDVWDDVTDTNLNGLYWLTKGLAKHLNNNGRIVNISSQLGKEGRAGYGAYCASKFGVIGLTKCWAKELGARGITVNAVCPGWVNTDMAQKDLERLAGEAGISKEEYYKQICVPLELKRFTEPQEVADLVAFLISEKGSGITGRDWLLHTIWNQE